MYLGIAVLCLSLILSGWRLKGGIKTGFSQFIMGVTIAITMTFGADLGGLMVYKYGVAVKAVSQTESHDYSMGGYDKDDMDMTGMTLEKNNGSMDDHHKDNNSMPHKH